MKPLLPCPERRCPREGSYRPSTTTRLRKARPKGASLLCPRGNCKQSRAHTPQTGGWCTSCPGKGLAQGCPKAPDHESCRPTTHGHAAGTGGPRELPWEQTARASDSTRLNKNPPIYRVKENTSHASTCKVRKAGGWDVVKLFFQDGVRRKQLGGRFGDKCPS